VSEPIHIRKANRWRATYNPLRGLTIARVVDLLEQGERGAYADLQWAYRYVEKRDATLRGLKRLRLAAIGKLDWDIKIVSELSDADQRRAEAQAKKLREAYERITNLRQAIRFLALAEFRGFSHLEKRYEGDRPGKPVVRLEPVEQWFWCRDTSAGDWQYNPEAVSRTQGEPVDLQHFMVREVEDPINEIGLINHVYQGMGRKDWAGFVETYGIPPIFGELPQNVPSGDTEKFQQMMEAIISDMRGTMPNGAKVHTVDAGARGVNPFDSFIRFFKEETVLAGTSGKLTMLNDSTGLGSGQSDLHSSVFDALAQAEAGEISELFQEHFDRQILGDEPALAYFEIAAEDQEDVDKLVDRTLKLKQAGILMDIEDLSERTGYKLTPMPTDSATQDGVPILAQQLGVGGTQGLLKVVSDVAAGLIPEKEGVATLQTVFGAGPAQAAQMLADGVKAMPQPAALTISNRLRTLRRTRNRQSPIDPPHAAIAQAASADVLKALTRELVAPVRAQVEAALAQDDLEQIATALEQIRAALPARLKALKIDGPDAAAIEAALVASLLNGLADAQDLRARIAANPS
jgi:hypothetical protein